MTKQERNEIRENINLAIEIYERNKILNLPPERVFVLICNLLDALDEMEAERDTAISYLEKAMKRLVERAIKYGTEYSCGICDKENRRKCMKDNSTECNAKYRGY